MKKLLTFTNVIGAVALIWGLAACATTASNSATNTSPKETMLSQAGFIPHTVATPKAQQQVATLAAAKVSAVTAKKKLYYVYPTGKKNQVLVGKQAHYDSYKKMLAAQAKTSSSANAPVQRDSSAPLYGETAGPHRISVEEMDGFEPIQDNPMWQ